MHKDLGANLHSGAIQSRVTQRPWLYVKQKVYMYDEWMDNHYMELSTYFQDFIFYNKLRWDFNKDFKVVTIQRNTINDAYIHTLSHLKEQAVLTSVRITLFSHLVTWSTDLNKLLNISLWSLLHNRPLCTQPLHNIHTKQKVKPT